MKNKGTFEENIVQDLEEDDIIKNKESFEKINAVEVTEGVDMYCDDLYMDMEYPPGFSKRDDAHKSMDIEELPPGFEECERTNIERFSEGPCDPINQVISELTVSVQNILHHRYGLDIYAFNNPYVHV